MLVVEQLYICDKVTLTELLVDEGPASVSISRHNPESEFRPVHGVVLTKVAIVRVWIPKQLGIHGIKAITIIAQNQPPDLGTLASRT